MTNTINSFDDLIKQRIQSEPLPPVDFEIIIDDGRDFCIQAFSNDIEIHEPYRTFIYAYVYAYIISSMVNEPLYKFLLLDDLLPEHFHYNPQDCYKFYMEHKIILPTNINLNTGVAKNIKHFFEKDFNITL